MRSLRSLAVLALAVGLAAGCGSTASPGASSTPGSGTNPAPSRPAPTSPSTTAPPASSAATQLAAFFAAAEHTDSQLRHAAALINGDIGATSMRFTPATIAAVRGIELAPAASALPAGLPTEMLRGVLVVYGDLASRTDAYNGVQSTAPQAASCRSVARKPSRCSADCATERPQQPASTATSLPRGPSRSRLPGDHRGSILSGRVGACLAHPVHQNPQQLQRGIRRICADQPRDDHLAAPHRSALQPLRWAGRRHQVHGRLHRPAWLEDQHLRLLRRDGICGGSRGTAILVRLRAVDGVSFRVMRGEIYALLGPNGAGKTTTVEILEGHRKRTSGSVRVLLMRTDQPTRVLAVLTRWAVGHGAELEELSVVRPLARGRLPADHRPRGCRRRRDLRLWPQADGSADPESLE